MTYLLFFLSGVSGLVYQVVWVRMFGNVFGNTIYSASIVVAVFMLGLGVGSYVVGAWADRQYSRAAGGARPGFRSLLQVYGYVELVIAVMGLGIAATLPHLGSLSALVSSYVRDVSGWYVLSTTSYAARAAIAIGLLTPITLLMGGTLTLLIRHLVRRDPHVAGWRVALLYGVNTAGAALGAALTDFALVPASGLWGTQLVAVGCNAVAGVGALVLAGREVVDREPSVARPARKRKSSTPQAVVESPSADIDHRAVTFTGVALAMSGFAALGMEILWFRHFTVLLGGFRAVFSLLLTLILVGMGIGSLVGGAICRRASRPADWLLMVQALFVSFTLGGIALADVDVINARGGPSVPGGPSAMGPLGELWFDVRPMLTEVAVPALLLGFAFPLANALVQRAEQAVGRRAGALYLANTAGAVAGSLAAGLVLLPLFGLQRSATFFMTVAALALVPLAMAARPTRRTLLASSAMALAGLGVWLSLPSDHVTRRSLGKLADGERRLVVDDGLTELVAVTETPSKGRTLVTNGHAMSSTWPMAQRYMRALAHLPLLSMQHPETVLVIGFGVGNTTQAATLHPSVQRVDLADLSRDILEHARYFEDGNRGVLTNPKVAVHINDGRQHLQMQPPNTYDLVVLEPPPIAYAGVSALYSSEFYELARARLRPNGYISQWLPAYQVPAETTLAMVRSFIDVFPQSVLVSGSGNDLLLLGTTSPRIEIDPAKVAEGLSRAPAVREDLERLDLGSVHEIVGTFLGSSSTLSEATRGVAPVIDDRPVQEYGVRSILSVGHGVPGSIIDLSRVSDWCPRCFANGSPVPAVQDLGVYLELLALAYAASPAEMATSLRLAETQGRAVAGSAYLGAIVPESAATYNVLGIALAQKGQLDAAVAEFRTAARLDPLNGATEWHLGVALASLGAQAEATEHLVRSVALDPRNGRAHADLGLLFAQQGRFDEAATHLQQAVALDPTADEARRNLALVEARRGPRRN